MPCSNPAKWESIGALTWFTGGSSAYFQSFDSEGIATMAFTAGNDDSFIEPVCCVVMNPDDLGEGWHVVIT